MKRLTFWSQTISFSSSFSFDKRIGNVEKIVLRLNRAVLQKNGCEKNGFEGGRLKAVIFDENRKRNANLILCNVQKDVLENVSLNLFFDSEQLSNLTFTFEPFSMTNDAKEDSKLELCLFGNFELPFSFTDFPLLQKNCYVAPPKESSAIHPPPSSSSSSTTTRTSSTSSEHPSRAAFQYTLEKENDVLFKPFYRNGVKITNLIVGHGHRAERGDRVEVYFKGKLDPDKNKTFDRCTRKNPIAIKVGSKGVIKGMNLGVFGMTVGGNRELVIPSRLGFGKDGVPGKVPPNATLYYDLFVKSIVPKEEVKKEEMEKQKEKNQRKRKRSDRFLTKEERRLKKRRKTNNGSNNNYNNNKKKENGENKQ